MMDRAINRLIEGHKRFQEKYQKSSLLKTLAEKGQAPKVMVVACSDSRVDPALIFDTDPGDIFTVRNVAAIIPPYDKKGSRHSVGAALEFGICFLKVQHLIIMGHSSCGGINCLINKTPQGTDFLESWVATLKQDQIDAKNVDESTQKALLQSHKNALSFPWVKQRVEQGTLEIHTWFFDIKGGDLLIYSQENQEYTPLR